MKKYLAEKTVVSLALSFLLFTFAYGADSPDSNDPMPAMSVLSSPFVENRGQAHSEVAFHTRLFNGTFHVTRAGEMKLQFPQLDRESVEPVLSDLRELLERL